MQQQQYYYGAFDPTNSFSAANARFSAVKLVSINSSASNSPHLTDIKVPTPMEVEIDLTVEDDAAVSTVAKKTGDQTFEAKLGGEPLPSSDRGKAKVFMTLGVTRQHLRERYSVSGCSFCCSESYCTVLLSVIG